jgi:hypothetical protein
MFDGLFDNRNRTVSDLIKLGDYLGRSLRENVSIFKIDTENRSVCYVSESNKVIVGNYTLDDQIALDNIVVEDAEVFSDNNKFDTMVDTKISSFVKNIYEDNHKQARSTFDDVLYLWESRLKFKGVQQKLAEKSARFNDSNKITESEEFQQFLEIAPELVNYLNIHREKISKIADIKNAVRLSQTVSEAFNVPKLDYETLEETGTFTVNEDSEKSVYEMICKQELVKKELLEHKANFDTVWASNQKVQALAGLIYSDESTVGRALSEAIKEVPYLALASKKQLTETFKNSLNLNGIKNVGINDIQEFASYIFETKKPARTALIKHLNERYGINVQNLKEPASFRSLLNTQVVIFETLTKISPKGSVQRDVLSKVSEMLKSKNGVEALDVNDVIQEVFQSAGYEDMLINESLEQFLANEKLKIVADILKSISPGSTSPTAAQGMDQVEKSPMQALAKMKSPEANPTVLPAAQPQPSGMDDDDVSVPPEGMGQEEAEEMGGMGQEEEVPPAAMSDEDLMAKMSELETLLANLKSEISGDEGLGADLDDEDGMEEEMPEEEMGEEEMPEEEGMEDEDEIDAEQAELDAEEDAIEAKHEKAHEIENEAEAEEEGVRVKQKKAEKKEDKLKRMK